MDFENRSELEAALLRGDLPMEGQTQAVVVAKACGVFDAQGRMTLDLGIPVPICFAPEPHPFGQVPADLAIVKQGLDVLALGKAYHPRIRPLPRGGGSDEHAPRVEPGGPRGAQRALHRTGLCARFCERGVDAGGAGVSLRSIAES